MTVDLCRVGTIPEVEEETFEFQTTPDPDILALNSSTGMISLVPSSTLVDVNFTVLINRTDDNTCECFILFRIVT